MKDDIKKIGFASSEVFTPLDKIITKAIVDSVQKVPGSLSDEDVISLVEEIVRLNSSTQHRYFHKGYLSSILNLKHEYNFSEENLNRKIWYLCGSLSGYFRKEMDDIVVDTSLKQRELLGQICHNNNPEFNVPYNIICIRLFEVYLRKNLLNEAINIIRSKVYLLNFNFIKGVLELAAKMLREGVTGEAQALLNVLSDNIDNIKIFHEKESNYEYFEIRFKRKQCQLYQLKGEFEIAKTQLFDILSKISIDDKKGHAYVNSDIGLIEGGIKSITEVKILEKIKNDYIVSSLEKGIVYFKRAIDMFDETPNANYFLGYYEYFSNDYDNAEKHLTDALVGMNKKEDTYFGIKILDSARFLLGASIFKGEKEIKYEYAVQHILKSIENNLKIPLHVWIDLIRNSGLLVYKEDFSIKVIEHLFLSHNEHIADIIVHLENIADMMGQSNCIENEIRKMTEKRELKYDELWKCNLYLLRTYLKNRNIGKSLDILDKLESLAFNNDKYDEYLEFIKEPKNYEPAWTQSEAKYAIIKILEAKGDFVQATNILRGEFYKHCSNYDQYSLSEACEIYERIKSYSLPVEIYEDIEKRLHILKELLPAREESQIEIKGPKCKILYVGGDERQERLNIDIVELLRKQTPNINVEFYHTYWKSNWGPQLEQIKNKISCVDLVVLSIYNRTSLGEGVREYCGKTNKLWVSSNGKGKYIIKNEIIEGYNKYCTTA